MPRFQHSLRAKYGGGAVSSDYLVLPPSKLITAYYSSTISMILTCIVETAPLA
jgi:hypothetical protein